MKKRNNRKGFTLAELLIVVAILAILIAVAIPIYTSALNDAQERVNQANARALKGAAVAQILSHWTDKPYSTDDTWHAWALFDTNGHMGDVYVRTGTETNLGSNDAVVAPAKTTDTATPNDISSDYTFEPVTGSGDIPNSNVILVKITSTDLNN